MSERETDPGFEPMDQDEPPRRGRANASLLLTVLGLGLGGYLLYEMRGDLAFWFSSQPTVDLGTAGAYRLEQARDGVVARIAGQPSSAADRFERFGTRYELVAVRGTPVLVRRALSGPDLPLPPGTPPPPPSQEPFTAEGRLVRDDSIPEYGHAFEFLVTKGAEPRDGHLFVLLDGERPRTGWKVPAVALALVGLVLLNAWTLVRALRRR